jgi:excisionase family DNA binding protein
MSNCAIHTSLPPAQILTVEEVAAFLKVPRTWVYERTRSRGEDTLPHFKLGKYLRFDPGAVMDYLERQRRG